MKQFKVEKKIKIKEEQEFYQYITILEIIYQKNKILESGEHMTVIMLMNA